MTTWITQRQAAELLGVGQSAVPKMVSAGKLRPRPKVNNKPTLDLAEVEALRDRRAAVARIRAEVASQPKGPQRPDADHMWLEITEAAALVGITKQAMNRRCQDDKMPSTLHGGRRWIRRDQLEMVERARAVSRGEEPPAWAWGW